MADTKADQRPNILIIVADDLGFSDCGCYGSEIQTPAIDAIAAESGGLRLTNYHVAAACAPTRSMLMTGTDHRIAGLGALQEFTRCSEAHYGKPGHEGYLNDRVVALPELLQDGGYHTMMSGKWHLGLKPEHHPVKRGFDRSFALLPGCANHYGYEPQYDDPDTEPHKFMETATRALHAEDDEFLQQLPDDFYSSDAYGDKLIEYLSLRTDDTRQKPFFAYLPFSAPHWPLQAPADVVARYRGMYDDGPDALRARRLERLKELGLVAKDVVPHEIVKVAGEPADWDAMPDDVKQKSARAMEVYAAMVERMDWNIGRVFDYLKSTGEYDNTFVVFMSDNGAEGASYEAKPILGDEVMRHIAKYYNNDLDNIGRKDSFVWYGSHWAQAATAPSRLFKMFSTEGGCRVPLVLRTPKSQAPGPFHTESGLVSHSYCSVMDIVPTCLDLAGLKHPEQRYKGRKIEPGRGRSWKEFLSAVGQTPDARIHDDDYVMGFENSGSAALRKGDWKIVYVPSPRGPQRWELFDLRADPGERTDLQEQQPEKFDELLALWDQYAADVGVVGLAGEFGKVSQGITNFRDEFDDPYGWIKYVGRPERTPDRLKAVVPVV